MPHRFSISTVVAEKPHCGKSGVPFMYSTTRCLVTWSRIFSCMSIGYSVLRVAGSRHSTASHGGRATSSFLYGARETRHVVLDEERVEDRDGQRSEQRARHQRPPVV